MDSMYGWKGYNRVQRRKHQHSGYKHIAYAQPSSWDTSKNKHLSIQIALVFTWEHFASQPAFTKFFLSPILTDCVPVL